MNSKDYKKAIIDGLLKKYNIRRAKNITTNRRIILRPAEVYKEYAKNNADIIEKQGVNEAVAALSGMGFITADYLRFSDDIEKIYLSEEKTDAIYEYLKKEYGVVPQNIISGQIREIVERYNGAARLCKSIVRIFCCRLKINAAYLFPKE